MTGNTRQSQGLRMEPKQALATEILTHGRPALKRGKQSVILETNIYNILPKAVTA